MGPRFAEDDHLISSLLDLANLRFAPMKGPAQTGRHGIVEMADLQEKFRIFSAEHSLADSFAVLGLGGFWNPTLKSKLYTYLSEDLPQSDSRRIVDALVENFARKPPRPVFFTTHDRDQERGARIGSGRPLTYMDDEYLIVSFPMMPWRPTGARP
jgi:hypothetical protein